MSKISILLISILIILSYQNCSNVEFEKNQSEELNSDGTPILPQTQLAVGRCFDYLDDGVSGPCSSNLKQTIVSTKVDASGNLVVRVTFPKTFVDNTYGLNSIGWGNIDHPLDKLIGSDHVELSLYDKSQTSVLSFKLDYISKDKNNGAYTAGVDKMGIGNEASILGVKTSIIENFNTYGYVLETDSPATDASYTVNATYPNWIYEVWYEVTVDASVFAAGGGFSQAAIDSIHASPSKIDQNTCEVTPAPCEDPLPNLCVDNDDSGSCDSLLRDLDDI